MLVRCLYASRAAQPLTSSILDEILEESRRRNPELGVTGLLCVSDNTFIQVLEGGRDEVCDLYNAIVRDSRHEQVRLLVYEEVAERAFGGWTMGQVNVARTNPALLLKYFTRARLDPFEAPGKSTLSFLTELVRTSGITPR
jgi:hypothetical protein